jgi:hypothetical protein
LKLADYPNACDRASEERRELPQASENFPEVLVKVGELIPEIILDKQLPNEIE